MSLASSLFGDTTHTDPFAKKLPKRILNIPKPPKPPKFANNPVLRDATTITAGGKKRMREKQRLIDEKIQKRVDRLNTKDLKEKEVKEERKKRKDRTVTVDDEEEVDVVTEKKTKKKKTKALAEEPQDVETKKEETKETSSSDDNSDSDSDSDSSSDGSDSDSEEDANAKQNDDAKTAGPKEPTNTAEGTTKAQNQETEPTNESNAPAHAEEATEANREEKTVITDKTEKDLKYGKQQNGHENDEANDRTIFVGNLPLSITRKQLAQIFKHCGRVHSTRIRSQSVTGVKLPPQQKGNQNLMRKVCVNTNKINTDARSTSQGYVVFEKSSSIEAALKLNNKVVPRFSAGDGTSPKTAQLRMRVDTSNPTNDHTRSIFIGNLPYATDEESLRIHVETSCGFESSDATPAVEGVRVVRDAETQQCKGFSYVLLRDRGLVTEAIRGLTGTVYQKRELRVQVCGKRTKATRGVTGDKKPKGSGFEGRRANLESYTSGAQRRMLGKLKTGGVVGSKATKAPTRKRRTPSEKSDALNKNIGVKRAPDGVSRRQASEAKLNKRVKKLQKRVDKGMGKTKKK